MYFKGQGVSKDKIKARELWERAAAEGDEDARRHLKNDLEGSWLKRLFNKDRRE